MRRVLARTGGGSIITAAAASARHRQIHDALPRPVFTAPGAARKRKAARVEAAKRALLHLNVMADQGIEPDVLAYTDLISVVGGAGLEWQAYKLFSRLLGQGLTPLPETYLALQRATHPSRTAVIADLERRIHESSATLPQELAAAEDSRAKAAALEGDAAFEALLGEAAMRAGGGVWEDDPFAIPAGVPVTPAERNAFGAVASSSTPTVEASHKEDLSQHQNNNNTSHARGDDDDDGPHHQPSASSASSLPTMNIDTPRGVLAALDALKSHRHDASITAANAERAPQLRQQLEALADDELRILLAIHRQFRHGGREDLVERCLLSVPGTEIDAAVRRRQRYFRAVGDALEVQMREMRDEMAPGEFDAIAAAVRSNKAAAASGHADGAAGGGDGEEEDRRPSPASAAAVASSSSGGRAPLAAATAGTDAAAVLPKTPFGSDLAPAEASRDDLTVLSAGGYVQGNSRAIDVTSLDEANMQPVNMKTPWGTMQRPEHSPDAIRKPGTRNPERDAAAALSDDEIAEVYIAARTRRMEDVSLLTLQRYCRMHKLGWKRRNGPTQLAGLVEWHVETYTPVVALERARAAAEAEDPDGPIATGLSAVGVAGEHGAVNGDVVAARQRDREARIEDKAAAQTRDEFNALRVIAQRCGNLKLVDSADISKAIARARARERIRANRAKAQQKRLDMAARRRALEEAMRSMPAVGSGGHQRGALAAPEEVHTLQVGDAANGSRVRLGDTATDEAAGPADEAGAADARELPPWAVKTGSARFDFKTGRFGDPTRGQIREQADGSFGIGFGDQRGGKFAVDVAALPDSDRAEVTAKLLAEEARTNSQEEVAMRQLRAEKEASQKHQRLRSLIDRVKKQKAEQKLEQEKLQGRPVQTRRMSAVLKRGRDTVKAQRRSPGATAD